MIWTTHHVGRELKDAEGIDQHVELAEQISVQDHHYCRGGGAGIRDVQVMENAVI